MTDKPLIALSMIVRNDSAGLQRAIESARPHVDEIVVGIDARTEDPETRAVAQKHADVVWDLTAADMGLTPEQWSANAIHFSRARNLGQAKVRAPWTLILDSDEFLTSEIDLRALVRRYMFTPTNAFALIVNMRAFVFRDAKRLIRTNLQWESATHNQLVAAVRALDADAVITQDLSLRPEVDRVRRDQQRADGIERLRPLAVQGDPAALFHLAKHELFQGDVDVACQLAERFRAAVPPRTAGDDRATLAVAIARQFKAVGKSLEATMWAVRALEDGPCKAAFSELSALAEARGAIRDARTWHLAASITPEAQRMHLVQ